MQERLEINFKGKKYTSKPFNVGNMVDLEKAKAMLSAGQWGGIYRANTLTGDESLVMMQTQAAISIFFPELLEDLKPKSIMELGIKDYIDFRKLYTEKIEKWVNSHIEMLRDTGEENDKSNQ